MLNNTVVSKIPANISKTKPKVAAYCRVSTTFEVQAGSFQDQKEYYERLIQNNTEWEYAGVYSDLGMSGTQTKKRDDFNNMIDACRRGEIDIILTKSISRFARNTVDLLEYIRLLKELNIDVRFEKENISTLSSEGEFMLSLLASFAQEESRSISENIKFGIRKRYQNGIPNCHPRLLGYKWVGDQLVVIPEEAKIVKYIFESYISGYSLCGLSRTLNELGYTSIHGNQMNHKALKRILKNEKYMGCMLLQKRYIKDPITKKVAENRGELPQYFVEDSHEPIISKELYLKVQEELKARTRIGPVTNRPSVFCGKIFCGHCGSPYYRANNNGQRYYVCKAYMKPGLSCDFTPVYEHFLDEVIDKENLEKIYVYKINKYQMKTTVHNLDGSSYDILWERQQRTAAYHPIEGDTFSEIPIFKDKMICAECGGTYTMHNTRGERSYHCSSYTKKICPKTEIYEEALLPFLKSEDFEKVVVSRVDDFKAYTTVYYNDGERQTIIWTREEANKGRWQPKM